MNNQREEYLITRYPELSDLEVLHALIVKSTAGKTKITVSSLREDLFGPIKKYNRISPDPIDPSIDIDVNVINNCATPPCQALLAEMSNGLIIGYVIYHYFYSPWVGHSFFVDDIFVEEGFRGKGFGKILLEQLALAAQSENMAALIFNSSGLSTNLLNTIQRYEPKIVRDDKTDWSVYRIDFDS